MIILPKIYTRDFPLCLLQLWGKRYRSFFGVEIEMFPRNICLLHDGVWDAYRHAGLNDEIDEILLRNIGGDSEYVKNLFLRSEEKIKNLKIFCERTDLNQQEFRDFIDLLFSCWDSFYAGLHIPLNEKFCEEDRALALQVRERTDQFEYQAFNHVRTVLKNLYPHLGSGIDFISLEEIFSGNIPSKEVLSSRQNERLILVDDVLISSSEFSDLQVKFDFRLEAEKDVSGLREFSGQVACPGIVRGIVRVVKKNDDMDSFLDNEILVAPMTIPTFLPIMKRASAFITDEGGITCHAAIVAREMKKPCIIGTKIATRVLKDGDFVEVDADHGVVRIIKKNA